MNKKQLENDKNLKQFIPFKSGLNLNNTVTSCPFDTFAFPK